MTAYVVLRQITPGSSRAKDPENPIEDCPVATPEMPLLIRVPTVSRQHRTAASTRTRWTSTPSASTNYLEKHRLNPALATISVMRQRVRTYPGWKVVELPTGHAPMVTMPEELTQILLDCGR